MNGIPGLLLFRLAAGCLRWRHQIGCLLTADTWGGWFLRASASAGPGCLLTLAFTHVLLGFFVFLSGLSRSVLGCLGVLLQHVDAGLSLLVHVPQLKVCCILQTLAHVRIPTTAKLGGGSGKGGGGALMNAPTVIKQNTAKAKSKQKKEMKTDDGQGGGIGGKGIFNGGARSLAKLPGFVCSLCSQLSQLHQRQPSCCITQASRLLSCWGYKAIWTGSLECRCTFTLRQRHITTSSATLAASVLRGFSHLA